MSTTIAVEPQTPASRSTTSARRPHPLTAAADLRRAGQPQQPGPRPGPRSPPGERAAAVDLAAAGATDRSMTPSRASTKSRHVFLPALHQRHSRGTTGRADDRRHRPAGACACACARRAHDGRISVPRRAQRTARDALRWNHEAPTAGTAGDPPPDTPGRGRPDRAPKGQGVPNHGYRHQRQLAHRPGGRLRPHDGHPGRRGVQLQPGQHEGLRGPGLRRAAWGINLVWDDPGGAGNIPASSGRPGRRRR